MIKVLIQLNSLGFGGTEKSVLTYLENLDGKKFEVYVYLNSDVYSLNFWRVLFLSFFSRRYQLKKQEKYVRNFARLKQFQNATEGRVSIGNGFKSFRNYVDQIKPDIIHFNRGLEEDFYTRKLSLLRNVRFIETSIFGKGANQDYLSRLSCVVFISEWLRSQSLWAKDVHSQVLYFPVRKSSPSARVQTPLRETLRIPNDSIVLGRLSRPELDDGSFILQTFKEISNLHPNVVLLTIGASEAFKAASEDYRNVINLAPTVEEERLESFFMSLDLFLHYRIEGETFGLNIAEALSAGVPVVTHRSEVDNAQVELVTAHKTCGVVSEALTPESYAQAVHLLIRDLKLRQEYSRAARAIASELFAPKALTKKLESIYESILDKN